MPADKKALSKVQFFIDKIEGAKMAMFGDDPGISIALGPNGAVHIARVDEEGALAVWSRAGDEWKSQHVRDPFIRRPTLAADGQGRLHLVYYKAANNGRKITNVKPVFEYASFNGSKWKVEPVTGRKWSVCPAWGFDVDGGGKAHLVFGAEDGLHYAVKEGKGWKDELVGPSLNHMKMGLALDGSGRPHVVYVNKDFTVAYAVKDKKWKHEAVGAKYTTNYPSIAVDAQGNPHITYMAQTTSNDRLMYAQKKDGKWSPEAIDGKGNNGFHNRIVLDSRGRPHIGYQARKSFSKSGSEQIVPAAHRYAVLKEDAWNVQEVAQGGWHSSLAVTPEGNPLLAFPENMKGGLSLAHTTGKLK